MAIYTPAEDAMAHHAANTAAVAIPIASAILHLPEILTAVVSFMGILWYGILIYDWVSKKVTIRKQLKQSSDRVAKSILAERHPDVAPLDEHSPPSD